MKEDKKQKFNTGHFPVGTIAKVYVTNVHGDKGPVSITVAGIAQNGPNSFLIYSDEVDEHTGRICYNIDHVVEIVKRGDGAVVFEDNSGDPNMYAFAKRDEWPEIEIKKHHSRYLSFWGQALLNTVSRRYVTVDMCVDYDAMFEYMVEHGYIKLIDVDHFYTTEFCYHRKCILTNKKKFKRAIKRLINKFAVNRKVAQQKEYAAWGSSLESSFDADHEDMNLEHEDRSNGFGGDMDDDFSVPEMTPYHPN